MKNLKNTLIKNKLFLFVFIIPFMGCENSESHQTPENNIIAKVDYSFFDFDEIIHYNIEIAEDDIFKSELSKEKNFLKEIVNGSVLQSFNDTLLLDSLEALSFKKNNVNSKIYSEINSIFSEKKNIDPIYLSCIAIYRDILIFKKSNKIIGIAKICFTCGQHTIVGTNLNTNFFGQEGDYAKLNKLLSK